MTGHGTAPWEISPAVGALPESGRERNVVLNVVGAFWELCVAVVSEGKRRGGGVVVRVAPVDRRDAGGTPSVCYCHYDTYVSCFTRVSFRTWKC